MMTDYRYRDLLIWKACGAGWDNTDPEHTHWDDLRPTGKTETEGIYGWQWTLGVKSLAASLEFMVAHGLTAKDVLSEFQQFERDVETERAELARLKAKYETTE